MFQPGFCLFCNNNFWKILEKTLDKYTHWVYNTLVRRITKGSEDMSDMTAAQTVRLIEWLKAKGLTDAEIVECLKYINENEKR